MASCPRLMCLNRHFSPKVQTPVCSSIEIQLAHKNAKRGKRELNKGYTIMHMIEPESEAKSRWLSNSAILHYRVTYDKVRVRSQVKICKIVRYLITMWLHIRIRLENKVDQSVKFCNTSLSRKTPIQKRICSSSVHHWFHIWILDSLNQTTKTPIQHLYHPCYNTCRKIATANFDYHPHLVFQR